MPRASIPPRMQSRQLAQQVAVAQRDASSTESVLIEQIETVDAGVPSDLAATIASLEATATSLEATATTLNATVADHETRLEALEP
jgi:hypothetical protein